MPFNVILQCHTSIYCYNCGLNCLSRLLIHKLETGELQGLLASDATSPEVKAAYDSILDSFQEYYELSDKPTWDQLNALFQNTYVDPPSREVVLGSLLRAHLYKVLTKPEVVESYVPFVQSAVNEYILTGKKSDAAIPIITANQEKFDEWKEELEGQILLAFNNQAADWGVVPDDDGIYSQAYEGQLDDITNEQTDIFTDMKQNEIENYWLKRGADLYAKHMIDASVPLETEYVSADQLNILAKQLNIDVEIYSESTENPMWTLSTGASNAWVLKLYNPHKVHWEFEEFSGNQNLADKHNEIYANNNYEVRDYEEGEGGIQVPNEIPIEEVQAVMLSLEVEHRPEIYGVQNQIYSVQNQIYSVQNPIKKFPFKINTTDKHGPKPEKPKLKPNPKL